MKKYIGLCALIVTICMVYSCDQVFEEDLSGITVETISPKDNAVIDEDKQTFWWKEVDDIVSYRVVIVQPSFSDPEFIVLDTTLTALQFTQDVSEWDSSRYEWTVFGVSGESETDTTAHPFVITTGKNISGSSVTLLAPQDNVKILEADQTFWWTKLEDADYYRVIIVQPSFASPERVILDSAYTESELKFDYDLSDLDSSKYEWTVLGVNGDNYSDTTIYTFVVTGEVSLSEQKVVLQSPDNNHEFATNLIELEWKTLNGADDYIIEYDQDIDDLYDGNGTIKNRTGGSSGDIKFNGNKVEYFWRVKGRNSLGSSKYSEVRRFYFDTTATN